MGYPQVGLAKMIIRAFFFGLCPLVIACGLVPYTRYLTAHPVQGYVVHPDGIPVAMWTGIQLILLSVASILLANAGAWDSWLSIRPIQWFLSIAGVWIVVIVTFFMFIGSMDSRMENSTRWTLAAAAMALQVGLAAAWAFDFRWLFLAAFVGAVAGYVGTALAAKHTETVSNERGMQLQDAWFRTEIDKQTTAGNLLNYTRNVYSQEIRDRATAKIESLPDWVGQLTRLFDAGPTDADKSGMALLFLTQRLHRLPPEIQEKCWAQAGAVANNMLDEIKVDGKAGAVSFADFWIGALQLLCAQSAAQRQSHHSILVASQKAVRGPFADSFRPQPTGWLDAYVAEASGK